MLFLFLLALVPAKEMDCPWDREGIDKALYFCNPQLPPLSTEVATSNKTLVKVGLLLPQKMASCTYVMAPQEGLAAKLAIEDINADPDLIPGYELKLVEIPSYSSCDRSLDTLGYAYRLRYQHGVEVLVGPVCGDESSGQSVASFAAAQNMPVISVASFSDQLNDVEKYPTFTRVYESAGIQAHHHAAIYRYFGWEQVAVFTQREHKVACTAKWDPLSDMLRKMDFSITDINEGNTLTENEKLTILQEHRIMSVFSSPDTFRSVVLQLHESCQQLKWCKWSNYRFIAINFQIGPLINNDNISPWTCDQSLRASLRLMCSCCSDQQKEDDEAARQAFSSVIYLIYDFPKFKNQSDYFCRFMTKVGESTAIPDAMKPACIEKTTFSQFIYDTVLLYAHALNVTKDHTNGREITRVIKQLDNIQGKTGRIITNPLGSRYSDVLAFFLNRHDDDEMSSLLKLVPDRTTGVFRVHELPGQTAPTRVPDRAPCSWDDMNCSETPKMMMISCGCFVIVAVIVFTAVRIYLYVKHGPEQSFVVSAEELRRLTLRMSGSGSKRCKQAFIQTTDIRISLNDKKTLQKLREIHKIHHPNIVELLHCCIEPGYLTLVLEECSKGLLHNLIQTESRVQTAPFIKSFAMDILRGVSYLHSGVFAYHGALTSRNCVVDARWNVKLKGFYLRNIECEVYSNTLELQPLSDPGLLHDLLWMSPDFVRGSLADDVAYRANDIYSFGAILSEMLTGAPLFGVRFQGEEVEDSELLVTTIAAIKLGLKPHNFNQENISTDKQMSAHSDASQQSDSSSSSGSESSGLQEDSLHPEDRTASPGWCETEDLGIVRRYVLDCTETDPAERPSAKQILARLESGSQNFTGTLLDQWLVTLEKRSSELKKAFDLKYDDVKKEKERTRDLVYCLLPREIAEQKMAGEPVAPQLFSNCSFFYSDIKGFTKIVADLPGGPMDVVSMLDNLYTIMDQAISKYNVVKVETIGDAYVVVSGLPIPDIDSDAHARNIASFALEVISTTRNITVPQLDDRPVYMRIGIHSGSCVAGIAGRTMFHYCIYGKEPRYANSLESSGEALRVQMSKEMRDILQRRFPERFSFIERKPSVAIPGFKTRRTFWLTGEKGVARDMPEDVIYEKLEFKRKISNTLNPGKLKGIAKLREEVNWTRARTASECSEKRKRTISETMSQITGNSK